MSLKTFVIGNLIIEGVFYICVTVAAIYFGKPAILAWYLFGMVLGYKCATLERSAENAKTDRP